MAYTPLQPGQDATFGSSGQGVLDLQNRLNTQNAGQPGWVPLKTDSLYGPLTQAALNFKPNPGPGIFSTTPIRTEFNQNSALLDNLDANDPYRLIIQKQLNGGVDPREQTDISNATAKSKRAQQQTIQQGDEYLAGVKTAGIQGGSARYTPDLYQGKIDQAHTEETQKLAELQDMEEIAIARAKDARAERDATKLKELKDYILDIRKAKADQLEKANEMAWEREKFYALHPKGGSSSVVFDTKKKNQIEGIFTTGFTNEETGKEYNGRGADGKVDPYLYFDLFNEVKDDPTAVAQFLTKFKPSEYLNAAAFDQIEFPEAIVNAFKSGQAKSSGIPQLPDSLK